MKITMKVMLMSLAMVVMTVFVNAQPQGGPGGQRGGDLTERAKKETERLSTNLELTEKQTKKVEKINLKYAEQTKAIREQMMAKREAGEEINREDMREQMQTLRTAQADEIKGVLTPAQIEKFDAMMEERKAKGQERRKKGKKGKKGKKAKEKAEEGVEESDN
ncbi:MAG: Spy/CpxP family protein refolding chaperone [Saprospiraceae bacterium]